MAKTITGEQLEELECAVNFAEYLKLLKRYTGIEAVPYTAHQFFAEDGKYIGDSSESSTLELLKAAYIEVEG